MHKNVLVTLIFLFLSAFVLSLEFLLACSGLPGLCQTSGCKLAANYIFPNEIFLLMLGAGFFWVLFLSYFVYRLRPGKFLWHSILIILLFSLAVDGTLLGYQLMGLKLICLFCIATAAALLISGVLLARAEKNLPVLFLCIAVWLGGFIANSLLIFPSETPELSETAIMHKPANVEKPVHTFYLFLSFNCNHCAQILFNLSLNKNGDADWYICSLDNNKKDLNKLAMALNYPESKQNPFKSLLLLKQQDIKKSMTVPAGLKKQIKNARVYLKNTGYNTIPVLISKEAPGRQVVLQGTNSISNYLLASGIIDQWEPYKDGRFNQKP